MNINKSCRIEKRFKQLKEQNKGALVTFSTAGDPDLETAQLILNGLPKAGADIIELGMPFSDPMADGPAIQLANLRALENGMTLPKTLEMVYNFRQNDNDTPVILMGYYNPIHHYGTKCFIDAAIYAGVDGLIIVDLPLEEDNELCYPCLTAGLHWIRLITPTTDQARLKKLLEHSAGFIYYVSITGITGTRSANQRNISLAIKEIRQHTSLPIVVGFGIKTAEQVKQTTSVADGAVVGSELVNQITNGVKNALSQTEIVTNVHQLVLELAVEQ